MISGILIRRAQPVLADAQALCQVEHLALGDSHYTPEIILGVLQLAGTICYLAWAGEQPVGLCACFETVSLAGQQVEIDLLGVLPAYRRRGIAAALVRTACTQAALRGIRLARAVVEQSNIASRQAFAKAGLVRGDVAASLMVYPLAGRSPVLRLPAGLAWQVQTERAQTLVASRPFEAMLLEGAQGVARAVCLQVRTLVYAGVWIEHLQGSPEHVVHLIRVITAWAAGQELDQVGMLCIDTGNTEPSESEAFWRAGFESLGRYYVFHAG